MKKSVCLITLLLVLLLTSCMKGVIKTSHMFMDDEDLADARIEKIFNSLKNKDKDELKSLFSKKAISEADNFNDSVDDLLSFIQGDLLSWSRDGYPEVSEEIENGNNSKQLMIWFYLKTDKQNYLVFLVDYPVDTINKDNAGLYSLRIIKAEGENKWDDYAVPALRKNFCKNENCDKNVILERLEKLAAPIFYSIQWTL